MWIDDDGRVWIAAPARESRVVSTELRDSLRAMPKGQRRELYVALMEHHAEIGPHLQLEASRATNLPRDLPIPDGFLQGTISSVEEGIRYVDRVDLEWRLDALMVLESYVGRMNRTPWQCLGDWIAVSWTVARGWTR